MAYDAARGQTVVFGGLGRNGGVLADTWAWNGTDWNKQDPDHRPKPRYLADMAYDAARQEVVLFGGNDYGSSGDLRDTWTWDGTDWTHRHPLHSPPARDEAAMAYDAANRQVVLFGGEGLRGFSDTWTWDGTDWTRHSPRHIPPSRLEAGMADDPVTDQVLLFGGLGPHHTMLADTWSWDGSDWTRRAPSHAPEPRWAMGMADDTGLSRVVLFGGFDNFDEYADTWTWDGADWTNAHPPHHPSIRQGAGMDYDVDNHQVVLFGGNDLFEGSDLGDTWTWNGPDWRIPIRPSVRLKPSSGAAGSQVTVRGSNFGAFEAVTISFIDSKNGRTVLATVQAGNTGALKAMVSIPDNATPGPQVIKARSRQSGQVSERTFIVG